MHRTGHNGVGAVRVLSVTAGREDGVASKSTTLVRPRPLTATLVNPCGILIRIPEPPGGVSKTSGHSEKRAQADTQMRHKA